MGKRIIRLLVHGLLMGIVLFVNPGITIEEQSVNNENTKIEFEVMADRIVLKTRVFNGKLQFRRFNATKNRWVDPDWINAEDFEGSIYNVQTI